MSDIDKEKTLEMAHIDHADEKGGEAGLVTDKVANIVEQESRATLRDTWRTHKKAMFWSMGVSMARPSFPIIPETSLTSRSLSWSRTIPC
jgi:hypothetical protein